MLENINFYLNTGGIFTKKVKYAPKQTQRCASLTLVSASLTRKTCNIAHTAHLSLSYIFHCDCRDCHDRRDCTDCTDCEIMFIEDLKTLCLNNLKARDACASKNRDGRTQFERNLKEKHKTAHFQDYTNCSGICLKVFMLEQYLLKTFKQTIGQDGQADIFNELNVVLRALLKSSVCVHCNFLENNVR